jgi:hypothetical protein
MTKHKIAGVKPEETVKSPAKEETVVKPTAKEVKETTISFEEAYKKQNPEKYAAKKKAGTFKVPALLTVIALIGALAVSFTVKAFYSNGTPKVVVEGNYIEAPQVSELQPAENIGAGSGPVNPFNWYSNGGINYMTVRGNMQTGTTTLCSFLNPFTTGTSTLESYDWQITTGTSTAATLKLATSTNAYATTTDNSLISTGASVASLAQASYSWNSGIGTLANAGLIPPNAYVLLATVEEGLSGYTYTGACQAVFRRMPGSL